MRTPLLAVMIGGLGCVFAGSGVRAQTGAEARAQGRSSALDVISRQAQGFRLATTADFLPSLPDKARGETLIEADVDGDGRADYAALVINPSVAEYRVYLVLAGHDEARLLFSRKWTAASDGHPIRTPMFLKPAGERGPVHRVYSPLRGRDADDYAAVPAIEVWTGQQHDERDSGVEDWAYCSRTWFFVRGQLRDFEVCD